MNRTVLVLGLLLCPLFAAGEYDPAKIKAAITAEQDTFKVTGWKPTDPGNGWLAETEAENLVLMVGERESGVISMVQDQLQAAQAMLRCMLLGKIGLGTANDDEYDQVLDVVQQATQRMDTASVQLRDVSFEVDPVEVGNVLAFSCSVAPEKT